MASEIGKNLVTYNYTNIHWWAKIKMLQAKQ